jgi:hypothetical protein
VLVLRVRGEVERLPDTTASRSIQIRLKKRLRTEPIERFRHRQARRIAEPLRERLELWAVENMDVLRYATPALPDSLGDRAQDCWEPLLAIADLGGEQWGRLARVAAVELSGALARDDLDSHGTVLLASIREAMGDRENIATTDLLALLNEQNGEAPWSGWNNGTGLKARNLSMLLKPFEVKSKTIRIGDKTAKGYARESFADAFERHLPPIVEGGDQ